MKSIAPRLPGQDMGCMMKDMAGTSEGMGIESDVLANHDFRIKTEVLE